jgi:lipopolysaccharide/colanic/teichoic acid biosynthesis glycosyltransferase
MQEENAGIIAGLNLSDASFALLKSCNFNKCTVVPFVNAIDLFNKYEQNKVNLVAIISESEVMGTSGINLWQALKSKGMYHIPFFLMCARVSDNLNQLCLQAGVAEVFRKPLEKNNIETRVNFTIANWNKLLKTEDLQLPPVYKPGFLKRSFDIVCSAVALLLLAPILLIVALLIKLESKGPVIYYSLRVGAGYKVFKFYKLRSMYADADRRLKDLMHLNQYNAEKPEAKVNTAPEMCDDCRLAGMSKCQNPMYADKLTWCEKQYLKSKKQKAGAAFFKLKNDPRITKVGNFIRNTSIDELPQLWNVLKRDMSIVGNRPLPLHEAEKLTTDKYALRFLAPAGLTGLWQVEKRGKGDMSEEERLMLDNTYAQNHSFWYDMRLILKTIPAMFQKENV